VIRFLPRPGPWLLLWCLSLALPGLGHAQDGGSGDGGMDGGEVAPAPDASVGEGGADRDTPEGEDGVGRVPLTCHRTSDCAARFSCQAGRCQYTGLREAERVGCLLGPEAAVGLLGLGLAARWRRKG
jgi:MYXO-CTERM domain-containing protein